jgi:hypothetical protein
VSPRPLTKQETEKDDATVVHIEALKRHGSNPGASLPFWFVDLLYLIDKADPSNADGTIDKEEMLEILHDAASLKTARLANSAEMEIKNQSPKMQEVLSTFDADGDGKISACELMAAAKAQEQMKSANKFLKAALLVLVAIVVLLVTMMFASAEAVKDVKPNAAGIATTVGALPGTSGGPMASAAVEEQVKLKDLWQEKYTVPMLKSMKTVSFETPTGQHVYSVVGANRRTSGDSTTTTIHCASGHQLKITQSSAMLLYPEALTGESEGVVERRLSQKVNGRYVEQIFMFHKNGRRLQDGGMEPFTAMEMASEWTMDETSPESMGPTTCEPGSELCSEDGFTFCSFPGWPCPAPMCDFDTEEECWSTPPEECWTTTFDAYAPVDSEGNPLNCESEMTCHPKSVGCPVYCADGEVMCTEYYTEGQFESAWNYCIAEYFGCPLPEQPSVTCNEITEVHCTDETTGEEYCMPEWNGCDPDSAPECETDVSGYTWWGGFNSQFDAGWGGCETYHDTCDGVEGYCSTWNHYWCQWDFMYFDQTYQWGSVGVFAYDACEQCQQCIVPKEGPTLAPTAVPTPFPTLAPSPFPTAWPTPAPTSPLITPSPTFMDDGHCGEMCGCTNTMGDRRLFAQGA